jgi:hypothetical protein
MMTRPQSAPGPLQAGTDVRNLRPWLEQLRATVAQCQAEITRLSGTLDRANKTPDIRLPPSAWDMAAMNGVTGTVVFARGQVEVHGINTTLVTPDSYSLTIDSGTWYIYVQYDYAAATAQILASATEPTADTDYYRKTIWVLTLADGSFAHTERRHWGNVEVWARAVTTPEEESVEQCIVTQLQTWVTEMRQDWPPGPLDTEIWCLLYATAVIMDPATGDSQTIIIDAGELADYSGTLAATDDNGDALSLVVADGLITNYEGIAKLVSLMDPATGDPVNARITSGRLYHQVQ